MDVSDRAENSVRVDRSDFAQVVDIYPFRTYQAASYHDIAIASMGECSDETCSLIREGRGDTFLQTC